MLMAPLSTAGVSDEVAQELQMLMGPQMLLVLQHSKIQALPIQSCCWMSRMGAQPKAPLVTCGCVEGFGSLRSGCKAGDEHSVED